jgi:hypothetical protein
MQVGHPAMLALWEAVRKYKRLHPRKDAAWTGQTDTAPSS